MLIKFLRLLGIDLPARMAEVRVEVEERFDLAKDSLEQAATKTAFLALLFFLAGLAALSAFATGLMALYSWVASNYGEIYGFSAVGGVLLFISTGLFAIAISRTKSWPGERASRVLKKKLELAQVRAERIAAATVALEGPSSSSPSQSSGTTAANDLIEPLAWALSSTLKLPSMGNPAMKELFTQLQSSAHGVADETVDSLVRTVRNGDRPQLLAALGGAMFVGWFLARHSEHKADVLETR
jgi:hypothetical protein